MKTFLTLLSVFIIPGTCELYNDSIFVPEIENKYTNTNLNYFYDEFVVSFVILSNGASTTSIIAISKGEDSMMDINIIEYIKITSLNLYISLITFTPNTWSSIAISQLFINDNNIYNITVAVNGTVQYYNTSTKPMVFTDANLYTFVDCSYHPGDCNYGSIKNLSIYSKTQVIWTKWSDWSQCNASCYITRTRSCSNNQLLNCTGKSIEVESCTNIYQEVVLIKNEFSLSEEKLIATLEKLNEEHRISFEIKTLDFVINDLVRVIHLTVGDKERTYGYHTPSVWFKPNETQNLLICFAFSGDSKNCITALLIPYTWSKVSLSQKFSEGKYNYSIQLNETIIFNEENIDVREFLNVKVYASYNSTNVQTQFVRSLKIRNGNAVPWAQWNGWSSCNVSYGNGFMDRRRECTVSDNVCCHDNYELTECFSSFHLEKETELIGVKLVTTLNRLFKEYIVFLELKPTSVLNNNYASVLHLTTNENEGVYGYRTPAIWLYNGKFHICSAINSYYDYCTSEHMFELGNWNSIKISQQLIEGRYMYSVEHNCTTIFSLENNDPREFSNVKIYASNPWHPVQPGFIRNLRITNGKQGQAEPFYLENETELLKGRFVATLDRLLKEYTVSFRVKLTAILDGPLNVFHLTTGDDHGTYGYRTPAMWVQNTGIFYICSAVNSNADFCKTTDIIKPDFWNSIKISQQLIDGNYMYLIEHNCSIVFFEKNTDPREFSNVKLYVSDPWYGAQPGVIRNLRITNGKLHQTAFWSQWSIWSNCNDSYGYTNRTRDCIVNNNFDWCCGENLNITKCYAFWTPWSNWSICNDTYGFTNRSRSCNASNPKDWCDGNNFDVMECYVLWTKWSTWYNSTDSYEFIKRTRQCNVSNDIDWCHGNSVESVKNSGMWTQWSNWSDCNVSCGFKNRMRECIALNVMQWCYSTKLNSKLNCTEVYLLKDKIKLSKGNLLTTINKLEKEFSVYFEIQPTVFINGFHNVIHLTTGVNQPSYGYRNPGVWFDDEKIGALYICYDINNKTDNCYNSDPIELGNWSSIKISQTYFQGKYNCSTELNGKMINNQQNYDAREFSNVKVYVSNPLIEAQIGFIRNLKITNGNSALWPNCSSWPSYNVIFGSINKTYDCNATNSMKVCYGNSSENLDCFAFWSQWTNWTSCNATYGFMNRTRTCNTSSSILEDGCYGNNIEVMECIALWSQWSSWSSCDGSYWFTNRSRECNTSTIFDWCVGNKIEVKQCIDFWSQWSNWTNCNGTYRVMNRTGECNISSSVNGCYVNSSGVMECFVFWDQWTNWTGCDEFNRFMNRSRVCKMLNTVDICVGDNSEEIECPAYWSQWSSWTVCNGSHGFVNRTRECDISNAREWCYVNNSEILECFASWAQWNNLINCDSSNGILHTFRDCKNSNVIDWCHGNNVEIMEYFDKWTTWSECSVTCGLGNRSRYSQHEKIKVMKVENCYQIKCPEDGMWGNWSRSECSSTCGKGIKLVNRSCDKPPPSYNGRDCIGVKNYTEDCDDDIICPINGNWSMWSSLSLCSQPCGGGLQSKQRSCLNPAPSFGGKACYGNFEEFSNCSLQICKSVKLNLNLNFIDEKYISYSMETTTETLNIKIQDAIAKLYSSRRVDFYVVIHSMENRP